MHTCLRMAFRGLDVVGHRSTKGSRFTPPDILCPSVLGKTL
jgi:hypothetical protein